MASFEKLREQAKEHLEPGENIVAGVKGSYETKRLGGDSVRTGVFLATTKRVFFYVKKTHRLRNRGIPLFKYFLDRS